MLQVKFARSFVGSYISVLDDDTCFFLVDRCASLELVEVFLTLCEFLCESKDFMFKLCD